MEEEILSPKECEEISENVPIWDIYTYEQIEDYLFHMGKRIVDL